jgi:hypothetical protein
VLKPIARVVALCVLAVPLLLMAAGCYEKLNGGGWMLSANGEDRATFGIHFDGPRDAARGTYHDHGTGVRLKFEGVVIYFSGSGPECAIFDATYKSQDKRQPGSGAVSVTACDEGEPGVSGDTLDILVLDGPYAGYENGGPILGGNFQGFQTEER